MTQVGPFIGGAWREAEGDAFREVVSPVTGEVLGEVPDSTANEVGRAADAARKAQPSWEASSAWERAAFCQRIAELLEERTDEIAKVLTAEQGKPYFSESLKDLKETALNFQIAGEDIKRLTSAILPAQDVSKRILTFRKANGVYAGVTPWNFPTLIPAELIAPAIAAGNTIVIKPSEWTPLSMVALMHVIADAGVPPGVVNLVYGDGAVGDQLVRHPSVDCVGFIGSHPTARKIIAAAGLKRSIIEASGNGPVIVCADADVTDAARGAVGGGFYCAGQVCCATERVIVNARVHDQFLSAVVDESARWQLGDPMERSTLVGPMNNEPTATKMDAHVADAIKNGAELVIGGKRSSGRPTQLYYEPTVVDGVTSTMLVHRDETFGPIVPIMRVGSDEEAIQAANDSHLGLRAAVYTRDLKLAFAYIDKLRVGNVVINADTNYGEVHLPFGGASGTQSGWGRIGGAYTMNDMTYVRTASLNVG